MGLLLFVLGFSYTSSAQGEADRFRRYLTGAWNNFQQCWMENTETESHRVVTTHPHRHVHVTFERDSATDRWHAAYYSGDQRQLLARYTLTLEERTDGRLQTILAPEFSVEGVGAATGPIALLWTYADGAFRGHSLSPKDEHLWVLKKDTLLILDNHFFRSEDQEPYRLLKCRFFSGWIQYPMDHIRKDSVFFYTGLVLHDQGGAVPLRFPDGTLGEYTVELTQLVHNRRTPILKLALYQEPPERLHWNSRAVAYAWADPAAKRIGLNIRKVASGWTLIAENTPP